MLYQSEHLHGGDIYNGGVRLDFSVNIHPLGMPDSVRQAIRESADRAEHYPDPYCRELVRAIARREEVPESYILCGNGAAELIYSWCEAVRCECAALTAPAFREYDLGLERAGSRICRYALREEQDFRLDHGFVEFLSACGAQAALLCNPNNPDGRTIPPELLREILDCCRQRGLRLFVDECFLDLSDDGVSLKEELAAHKELFILKAFTKNYGMAGVRLGYALSADTELLSDMARTVQPWNVSVPAQAAGVAALREREYIGQGRHIIRKEKPWVSEELRKLGFRVCRSEANYLLFNGPEGLDRQLGRQGIIIRNCSNYYGLGPGWYRIGIRRHEDNQALLQAMEQCLHS